MWRSGRRRSRGNTDEVRQASDVDPFADDGRRRVGGFADPGRTEELERVAQPEDLHATVRIDQVDAIVGRTGELQKPRSNSFSQRSLPVFASRQLTTPKPVGRMT
jgi:hypothetical protein